MHWAAAAADRGLDQRRARQLPDSTRLVFRAAPSGRVLSQRLTCSLRALLCCLPRMKAGAGGAAAARVVRPLLTIALSLGATLQQPPHSTPRETRAYERRQPL